MAVVEPRAFDPHAANLSVADNDAEPPQVAHAPGDEADTAQEHNHGHLELEDCSVIWVVSEAHRQAADKMRLAPLRPSQSLQRLREGLTAKIQEQGQQIHTKA